MGGSIKGGHAVETLTREQEVALAYEIDALSTLFRHGFAALHSYRFALRDAEVIFACLSSGCEKFLKLTYGLLVLDETRSWPEKKAMMKIGHGISALNNEVCERIMKRRELSTAPGLVVELHEASRPNPGVILLLETFDRYASGGRFHNLDVLSSLPPSEESAHDLWEELSLIVIEANPEFLDELSGPSSGKVRSQMNEIIGKALGNWCELVRRAWLTGICGEVAKVHGHSLDLGNPT
ncbi:MAG TPA: hypothetical protein VMF31_10475 [Solirubrobacterales bacterium]|nr:hypothetical protein [Solirubrobacterales bacterium]